MSISICSRCERAAAAASRFAATTARSQCAHARGCSARTTRCARCRLWRAVVARRHECCWTCRVRLRQLGPRRRVGRRVACAVRRCRRATADSNDSAWRDECGARRGHPRARSPSAAGYMSSCCVCAVSCVSEVFEQRTVIHGPWQPICRVLARNGEGQILTTPRTCHPTFCGSLFGGVGLRIREDETYQYNKAKTLTPGHSSDPCAKMQ